MSKATQPQEQGIPALAPFVKEGEQPQRAEVLPLPFITSADLEELTLPPREWMIEGVIPRGLLSSIVAQSGVGKTWLTLLLLRHFATGADWAGREVQKCRAGYLDLEDDWIALKQRWHSLNVGHGKLPEDAILPAMLSNVGAINILEEGWTEKLIASCSSLDVLFVDSLSRLHLFDGDKNADMAIVMSKIESVARETGCTIVLIHHAGWTPNGGAKVERGRGASIIRDYCQHELLMREENNKRVLLRLNKAKAGPKSEVAYMLINLRERGGVELTFDVDATNVLPGEQRRRAVYAVLRERGPIRYTELLLEVYERTKHGKSTIERELKKMRDASLIVQDAHGLYVLPEV